MRISPPHCIRIRKRVRGEPLRVAGSIGVV
jgi:hypothetical protein